MIYYKITEVCGDVSWFAVDPFVNHLDQQITNIIDELLTDLQRDEIEVERQSTPPTAEELDGMPLKTYTDLKMFLAMHILGLD